MVQGNSLPLPGWQEMAKRERNPVLRDASDGGNVKGGASSRKGTFLMGGRSLWITPLIEGKKNMSAPKHAARAPKGQGEKSKPEIEEMGIERLKKLEKERTGGR